MAFLAVVDAPLSSESMKFPVFSLLTGNLETETSSLVTAHSSSESLVRTSTWGEGAGRRQRGQPVCVFVVIVPVEDDGRVHLVEQYRYPVKGRYWEFPQGSWEREPGVDPTTYCTLHKIENLVVIPHDFFCLRVHRLDNNGPSYPPSSPHGIVQP